MKNTLTHVVLGVVTISAAILLSVILFYGIIDITQGIRDFTVPGADPFERIIEGLKTLCVIPVVYLTIIHVFAKKTTK